MHLPREYVIHLVHAAILNAPFATAGDLGVSASRTYLKMELRLQSPSIGVTIVRLKERVILPRLWNVSCGRCCSHDLGERRLPGRDVARHDDEGLRHGPWSLECTKPGLKCSSPAS